MKVVKRIHSEIKMFSGSYVGNHLYVPGPSVWEIAVHLAVACGSV